MGTQARDPMETRLDQLERKVDQLSAAVQRLEAKVEGLSRGAGGPAASPARAEGEAPGTSPFLTGAALSGWLSLLGRSFLVLGGAFLIRALTERGTLPRASGVALGLAFAAIWIALSYRAAAGGQKTSALFHGLSAAMVGYPLLLESSTRFAVLSVSLASATLVVYTAFLLAVAWRHRLAVLAWVAVLASLATVGVLLKASSATAPLTVVLLLLATATLWLADSRQWSGPAWPVALFLDLVLWRAVFAASRPDAPQAQAGLGSALALAEVAVALYLGASLHRALVRGQTVRVFDAVQTAAVLAVGASCIYRFSLATGRGEKLSGAVALTLALGAFLVAFAEMRRGEKRINFLFFSALGLSLVLLGGSLLTGGVPLALFWATLGVFAAWLGRRMERILLWSYAGALAWAAAAQSGLLRLVREGLFLGGDRQGAAPSVTALLVLGLIAASYALLVLPLREVTAATPAWAQRIPAGLLLGVAVLVCSAAAVQASWSALGGPPANPALLAAVRVVTLAMVALALAAGRRGLGHAELGWVAYLALGLGGLKLVTEHLPHGHAGTLFVAFPVYGLALILVPRLARARRQSSGGGG